MKKSFLKGIDIFCEIIVEMVAVEIEIDKYPEPGKKNNWKLCQLKSALYMSKKYFRK